ncbi:MAG: T9SS type A sorting domain-containing protein [Candidatus Cloacimonadota bacterium]|nr:MAG: T9SS type A sorting domain-containing protein [Candidatus Cloacimonadota bacterium]
MPTSGLTDSIIVCLSSTSDIDIIYAGTLSGIFKWSIANNTWKEMNTGLTNTDVRFIKVDKYSENIVYTGTADGLFKSINSGSTWVPILDKSILSMDIQPDSISTLYVGTNGEGIYKSIDGGSNWEQKNNGFTDWGPANFVYVVPSISIISGDTLFAGTRHGVFLTEDGGSSWKEINKGLLSSYVSNEIVDSVRTIFEVAVPSDSTNGMYDVCTRDFGNPPDIDNDPHIYIFLLTPKGIMSYFDDINEYDTLYSNVCEMLYLTCSNPTSDKNIGELAKSFQEMIHWNYDTDEEDWIVKGISMLSRHFILFGELNVDSTSSYFFPLNNDLTYWGDASDEDICGLWSMYLYEKYGGISMLKNLISDTLNGFEGVDNTLTEEGYAKTHKEIFKDWVIASYVNNPDSNFYSGKYGYNLIRTISVNNNDKDTLPPYRDSTNLWSANNIYLKYPDVPNLGDTLLFNGNTTNSISLYFIKLDSTENAISVDEIPLADKEARSYIGDFDSAYSILVPFIIITGDEGNSPVPYVFHNDLTPPEYVRYSFFQNPLESSYLNFYLFSSDRIYRDVGDETPLLEFTQGETVDTVTMNIFLEPGSDSIAVIYRGNYHFTGSGTASIIASGEDLAGNDIVPETTSISIQYILANNGGSITSTDGEMILDVPSKAISKDTYFTVFRLSTADNPDNPRISSFGDLVIKPQERETKGSAYRIGPTGLELKNPASLTIHYEGELDEEVVGIYRLENNGWVYIGGVVDEETHLISTLITRIGTYQIQLGPHSSPPEIPTVYAVSQNFPNPMKSNTTILYQLPLESFVSLKIYDIAGREVRTLVNRKESFGYKAIKWEGTDNKGRKLPAGVYFYRLKASNYEKVKRLVILR